MITKKNKKPLASLPDFTEQLLSAWQYFKDNMKNLLSFNAVMMIGVISFIIGNSLLETTPFLVRLPMFLTSFVVVMWLAFILQAGMIKVNLTKNTTKGVMELFEDGAKSLRFLVPTTIFSIILVVLGLVCLIVPGIVIAVYLSFAAWLAVEYGLPGEEAIKASYRLVKGYWWAILWRIAAVQTIFILGVDLVSKALGGHPTKNGDVVTAIINISLSFFLTPLFVAYIAEIYKDLKKIKKFKI